MTLCDASLWAALARINDVAQAPSAEPVPVEEAAGRVLAEDAQSRVDFPTETVSAMDGFAVRTDDGLNSRAILDESAAGRPATSKVSPGEAVRISTGAVMPERCDAVARIEVCLESDGQVSLTAEVSRGRDIRERGEVVRAGAPLLAAGERVTPHHVGALASAGLARLSCVRRPRVAVVSSGDELTPVGEPLGPGGAYDSNRLGLSAQARAAGAEVVESTRLVDDPQVTRDTLGRLLTCDAQPLDVLVLSGGVSKGGHDHVLPALLELDCETLVHRVRVRPCHPTWIGRHETTRVLALPGNPVAATLGFHVFGRPLLGARDRWERRAPLAREWHADGARDRLVMCRLGADGLMPTDNQRSHGITALVEADCVAWLPPRTDDYAPGEPVRFSPLG